MRNQKKSSEKTKTKTNKIAYAIIRATHGPLTPRVSTIQADAWTPRNPENCGDARIPRESESLKMRAV